MKKNKMMRIASVLLVAVLLSTCAISGTFAKYTSTAQGKSTVAIAKWNVTVSDIKLDTTAQKEFKFNLFDTIVDTKDGTPSAEGNSVATNFIAPGTKGEFSFEITNNSEVDAQFSLSFTKTGPEVPFTFSVSCTGETANNTLAGFNDVALDMGETVTIKVTWEWPFDGDHTSIGLTGGDVVVTANVTVEQVD